MKETFGMETMSSHVLPLLNSMMQVNWLLQVVLCV